MDKEIFVKNVEFLCRQRGIKPTNACIESGLGSSFLPDIKRGRTPSVEKVQLLAQYLGVTTSELLGEAPPDRAALAELSEEELQEVLAYRRAAPELQAAVRRVLGME